MTDPAPRPFSIRIFLPAGSPDGLRLVEKSNWTGCGVVCPRAVFAEQKQRDEFQRTGVYVLFGPSEDGDLPTIYVGEGDPVRPRLEQHYSKKDFWTWCAFFVSKDGTLNKAHVQHLEARLVQLARSVKRSNLDNQQIPQTPALSEAETADVESFLEDILSIFPLLGLNVFEKAPAARGKKQFLTLESKGITARGYDSPQGFVVAKGAHAVPSGGEANSASPSTLSLRQGLIAQGVLEAHDQHLEFTQEYVFSSPSTAASVVLGNSINGRTAWKDVQGRTLREIQEESSETDS